MKKLIILVVIFFFISCNSQKTGILNSEEYYNKYYRIFSFITQNFHTELKYLPSMKFCYKVYYSKKNDKRVAFEFINEVSKVEYIGFFDINEYLKKINVLDTSKGRMNMSFFYSRQGRLRKVKLLDDNKKIFAMGKIQKSNNNNLIFIKFLQHITKEPILFHIIRGNDQGRDLEIATYSNDGTLFLNHLYFYNDKNALIKYEFHRKLKLTLKIEFKEGRILKVYNREESGFQ